MVSTTKECIFLVEKVFLLYGEYTDLARQCLVDKFSDAPVPLRKAVRNIQETGSVDNTKHCERPAKLLKEKVLDISNSIQPSPRKSLWKFRPVWIAEYIRHVCMYV